ncbi:UNVERIFIED_CONTAM: protein NRT1/ PTR FAMILY 5.7 [Sesamum radiatum]|uniref:Protein NRT1/ PTR FAMILY 5.7 n=1 Tax=Sesamum radiatum TaxID=300843 RepID=A0AAW2R6G3_SESRA
MEQAKKQESRGVDEEKWVYDSSLDHKGRIPLRASTGAWKASLFIIAIEFSERLSYFGLATSLIIYLTKVIHEDLKTAAKSVNYWSGVTTLMPLLGGFVADAYLGRFSTVLVSSVIYLLGLLVLTMSRVVPGLKPCDVGICERPRRIHEDHISWAAADVILTAVMAFTILIFCSGRPFYRFRKPTGSPLTPLLQVLVAAIAKRKLPYPSEPDQLYEVPKSDQTQGRLLFHTKKLKFLDKAAIIEDGQDSAEKQNPWRLATVTNVEEMKLVVNMIPIWLTTIPFGICVAQASTFFIKQGTTLDRKITHDFMIPPASIYALAAIGMIISVTIYDKLLEPFLRRATGHERGIKVLQRIGIGMIFSVLTMVVAALVERKRLKVVERNPLEGSVSMSVFWLAPQFLIIGIGDGFALVGLQEYFYDQVPDSMRSLGIALYLSVIGAANFLSSLLITLVDHITEKGGQSWFGKDLNTSRLDYFYWLLAGITAGNICIFAFVASRYSYKKVRKTTVAVADCYEGDHIEVMA